MFDFTDDTESTVFRDMTMLALLGFVVMVILMIPHLNPPDAGQDMRPPGNVVVEVRWGDGLPADVDLWVQAPGDRPVGYVRKSGDVFDLLRDDLGSAHDLTDLNYEFAFSRGAPPGEYTVNLHLFNGRMVPLPVTADVVISIRRPGGNMIEIAKRTVRLVRDRQELTVARFTLDERARLVPGSLHDLPKQLRPVP